MSTDLIITGQMPAAPLVLIDAGIVARIETLTADATNAKITDTVAYNAASGIYRELFGLGKDIEAARKQVKEPFFQMGKRIDEAANKELARLTNASTALKTKLTAYQNEQDRLARIEADRIAKEQAELARQAAAAEKARKEAEEAAAAPVATDDDDYSDLGAEVAVEQAKAEQTRVAAATVALTQSRVVQPKTEGIYFRVTLKHFVADLQHLPDSLVTKTANDAEIRRLYCQGWRDGDPIPTVPGLTFIVDKQPIPRR